MKKTETAKKNRVKEQIEELMLAEEPQLTIYDDPENLIIDVEKKHLGHKRKSRGKWLLLETSPHL